jgi:hypothetical protein
VRYRAYPALALALTAGAAEVCAQPTTPPPPPTAAVARSPFDQIPPAGQWVWQQSVYGSGGGYWAFIKPQDPSNFRHVGTPTQ